MALFHEVVGCGSINQAASSLAISKASISRKLRSLEKQMGAVLLKRGQKRLSMTPSGEVLLQHCERMLCGSAGRSNRTRRNAVAARRPASGGRALSGWRSGSRAQLRLSPSAIREVEISIDLTHRWVDVSEEPYDVAIHLGRIVNEQLPVRRFSVLTRGVYVSPAYLKEQARSTGAVGSGEP